MESYTTLVRTALAEDAPALSCMNDEFNGVRIQPERVAARLLDSGELVAIAFFNAEAAGFACAQITKSFCYEEPSGEITELYVREGYRQHGIALALLGFLEDELLLRGVKVVRVLTGRNNVAAGRLYEKAGYADHDERVMEKVIAP